MAKDLEVTREVERYASEFGVSVERAWAEREKWEAEHAISVLERQSGRW